MKENTASISLPKSLAYWRGSRIYVTNAAHGIAMLAELDDTAGEVYNLAEEHPLTEQELAETVARLMNWRGEIRLEDENSVSMNALSINPLQHFIADTTKIRSLGYRESISLEEGLRRTIEWELKQPVSINTP
jgi:nucleoside-diphosphate-sugar epimerase